MAAAPNSSSGTVVATPAVMSIAEFAGSSPNVSPPPNARTARYTSANGVCRPVSIVNAGTAWTPACLRAKP